MFAARYRRLPRIQKTHGAAHHYVWARHFVIKAFSLINRQRFVGDAPVLEMCKRENFRKCLAFPGCALCPNDYNKIRLDRILTVVVCFMLEDKLVHMILDRFLGHAKRLTMSFIISAIHGRGDVLTRVCLFVSTIAQKGLDGF